MVALGRGSGSKAVALGRGSTPHGSSGSRMSRVKFLFSIVWASLSFYPCFTPLYNRRNSPKTHDHKNALKDKSKDFPNQGRGLASGCG